MKFSRLLRLSTESLGRHGIADAAADAELLLLHVLGTDRLSVYRDDPDLSSMHESHMAALMDRRISGEPVQYLIGHIDFLGLTIKVGRGVLIPRPETELLAQEAIRTLSSLLSALSKKVSEVKILDLCSGSGCLALALAREFPDAEVIAADISETALSYARENAQLNGIGNITFLSGSLFAPLPQFLLFDLIVSNPPYIRRSDLQGLQREVRDWEPVEALDGGEDGLDFYRKIFSEAGSFLYDGGMLMLEMGFGQADGIAMIARRHGFRNIVILSDFAGIPRIVKAERGQVQSSHLQG